MIVTLFFLIGLFCSARVSYKLYNRMDLDLDLDSDSENLNEVVVVSEKYVNRPGFDERPLPPEKMNRTDYIKIVNMYRLLKKLEENTIPVNEKVRMINAMHYLDVLNPLVVTAPNFTKGLRW